MSRSLNSAVLLDWNIPAPLAEELEKYYLLLWQGEYFRELVRKGYGRLKHQDTDYAILYYSGMIRETMAATNVAVSFRKMKHFPYGYVMVRPVSIT